MINITDNITKALDYGNIGCRVFVDLQKASNAVDHQIFLAKITMGFVKFQMIGLNPVCLIVVSIYL